MTGRRNFLLSFLLVQLVAAAILTGCGLGATPEPTPTSPPPRQLTVYMFNTPALRQVLDILLGAFRERYPNYTIQVVDIQDDPARELASLSAAGRQPDIIWTIDNLTQGLAASGALLDLRELARADASFNLEDIDPAVLAIGNGRAVDEPGLYMIPASFETVQLFYNKDLFEAAGAPLPQPNWTWNDLIEACQVVQAAHSGVDCLSFFNADMPGADWWAYWAPFVRGYGGDYLSADGRKSTLSTPESLAGLQAYLDLWTRHKVARAPNAPSGDCFVQQRCAVVFFASLGIRAFRDRIGDRFEWDVQIIPSHPLGRFTGAAVYGFGIGRDTRDPEAAWQFVKYLVTPEAQRLIVAQRLGMPVLKSLAGEASLSQLTPPPSNIRAFIDGAQYAIPPHTYPPACGSLYIGLPQEALSQALRAAFAGASLEQALKAADSKIQACLDAGR
ncbi:MAG: sugar ABC transporter substrate-binding protein [Anaerolineae bacterium]|nr:sugar ABC transporter substrate-binding protein [Thermoflexales bacterium]MDW8406783.1 sugar ABC transporter substrate-binding protein [Anaerolineae bacterium]